MKKKKKKVVGFIPTKFLCMRSQIGVIARIMETFVLGKTETSSSDSPFTKVVIIITGSCYIPTGAKEVIIAKLAQKASVSEFQPFQKDDRF
jgi:hypothetical protein